ncbi:unnamed protein product [Rotaria sp. Silwood2]|nr:unnamed protein product [Rotaria sp. Silwood2]CAF4655126.1 unnamed protein product [Rotaria sp. Silwood2]
MSSKSIRNKRRRENKFDKELTYESSLPPYEPVHKYRIYFLHELTSLEDLNYLINSSQHTKCFAIDTESNYGSNDPALIQILYIQPPDVESPMLLVEVQFLPATSSPTFFKIQQLFQSIFCNDSHLFTWGDIRKELNPFTIYDIFSMPIYSYLHQVQVQFKPWFNQWIKKYYSLPADNIDNDLNDIVIIDAPTYDPTLLLPTQLMNNKKFYSGETWSLQDAIVYTFGQYLSKRETLRQWSIGLDETLYTCDRSFSSNYRKKLIKYACLDCLTVAYINFIMQQSKIPLDMNYVHKQQQTSGEYTLSNTLTVVSDIFQLSEDSSYSSEQNNTELVAVHAPNERHQSPLHSIQLDCHQHETEAPALVSTTVPRSHKRSSIAKKKRNTKTSHRHRANRYNYEIIRPENMKITSIKKLLRENHIKYTNIHVVHSVLYIGVKSDGHKHLYEQLLPSDMFV